MSWAREEVTVLIEEYMKFPCLYAVKSKAYSNKHLRQQALENIQRALQPLKIVSINEIKNKFAGLKATFLNEHKKHISSIRSGAEEDEVYHPSLWYYKKLLFVIDHIEPRESTDSMSISYDCDEDTINSLEGNTEEVIINEDGSITRFCNMFDDTSSSLASTSIYRHAETPSKRKRSETEDVMKEAANALQVINKTLKDGKTSPENVLNDDVALSNFIVSKLRQITDANIRIDIEEDVARCLYNGIKKCRKYVSHLFSYLVTKKIVNYNYTKDIYTNIKIPTKLLLLSNFLWSFVLRVFGDF